MKITMSNKRTWLYPLPLIMTAFGHTVTADVCSPATLDNQMNLTIPCVEFEERYYQGSLTHKLVDGKMTWELASTSVGTCQGDEDLYCAIIKNDKMIIPRLGRGEVPYRGVLGVSDDWKFTLQELVEIGGSTTDRGVCEEEISRPNVSDKRWKKDIRPLENTLEKVSKLQGVNYQWDTENYPEMGFDDKPQIGFIAQEVEQVIPELVVTNNNGYKGVKYDKFTAVLVEAVKELKTQNDALKTVVCKKYPEESICQ